MIRTPPIERRQQDYQDQLRSRSVGRPIRWAAPFFHMSQRGGEDWSVTINVVGEVLDGQGNLTVYVEGYAGTTLGVLFEETLAISPNNPVFFNRLVPSQGTNPDDVRVRIEIEYVEPLVPGTPLRVDLEVDVGYAAQPQSVWVRGRGRA